MYGIDSCFEDKLLLLLSLNLNGRVLDLTDRIVAGPRFAQGIIFILCIKLVQPRKTGARTNMPKYCSVGRKASINTNAAFKAA